MRPAFAFFFLPFHYGRVLNRKKTFAFCPSGFNVQFTSIRVEKYAFACILLLFLRRLAVSELTILSFSVHYYVYLHLLLLFRIISFICQKICLSTIITIPTQCPYYKL